MSVNNSTITIENRLEEMINYLPAMKDEENNEFSIFFEYGDQLDLIDFLKQNKGADHPYPLIWLLSPYNEIHQRNKVRVNDLTIILAVQTNKEMLPKQRMKETFEKVLIPLFTNLKLLFLRSNIITVENRNYNAIKYYNYSGEDNGGLESETGDIWDAYKITFNCSITDNCLRPIKI